MCSLLGMTLQKTQFSILFGLHHHLGKIEVHQPQVSRADYKTTNFGYLVFLNLMLGKTSQ